MADAATTTTSNPVTTPQTYDELQQQAAAQAQQEISAQIAPLQSDVGSAQAKEGAAVSDIGSMFGTLQSSVADSAKRVESAQNEALNEQQQIFQAAGKNLNDISQGQAAEAQQLAQQMGGPVSTGEFTSGISPYTSAFPSEEAGGLLHALGMAQAGTQEAEQFAGQVFPAMQTEQTAKARFYYEDQIEQINKQIQTIQASKGGLISSKLGDMLEKERTFELNQAQLKLDQLKASRDWQATQHTLHNQDVELGIAKNKNALDTASVTGTYKGKPTLQATNTAAQVRLAQQRINVQRIKTQADVKLAAQRMGIDAQKLALQIAKYNETSKTQAARLNVQQTHNAMNILDAAMNPNGTKPVTQTVKQWIPAGSPQAFALQRAALTGKVPTNTYYDTKTNRWYTYQKLTLTPQQWAQRGGYAGKTPITDPDRLYDLLVGAGTPKGIAKSLVTAKTGLKDWVPGKNVNYTTDQLSGNSLNELRGLAIQRGWKPSRKGTKQGYLDFIISRNPSASSKPGVPSSVGQ